MWSPNIQNSFDAPFSAYFFGSKIFCMLPRKKKKKTIRNIYEIKIQIKYNFCTEVCVYITKR